MLRKVLLVASVQSHICQFHRPLAAILHEHGYEVHVAAKNNLAEKNGMLLDFVERVFDVPFSRSPKSLENFRAYKMLKNIIDETEYDVIHCNTPMASVLGRLAARNVRKSGTRVFYTAHGFHFYSGAPVLNWILYYPIEKIMSRMTDKLVTIVDEDFQLASKKFKCEVERIHGVGVDEKRFCPIDYESKLALRAKMGFSCDEKIILCVGELLPNKNQKMAFRALKEVVRKYPEAKLLVAGNGPEKENLLRLVDELELGEHVHFLGYVTNLQDYQHVADMLIACSMREGLGLNVIEAMLSGNAVVVADNRGHRELTDGGKNGIIVSKNDHKGMAKSIMHLFSDPLQKEFLEKTALEFSKKYNNQSVKKELEQIYGL